MVRDFRRGRSSRSGDFWRQVVRCCAIVAGLGGAGIALAFPADELADAQVEEAGNDVLAGLEHVNEFLKDQQWDDAVATLRRVMEDRGDRLMRIPLAPRWQALGFSVSVPLSDYCQMQLASWHDRAPAALALYRRRVDALALRWYEEAVAEHSEAKLQRIVDELLLSSHGDQALLRLGEHALERGNYTLARRCWESIHRKLRTPASVARLLGCPAGCSWWSALRGRSLDKSWPEIAEALKQAAGPVGWLAYPDTDIPLPAVRARLALVSILEGALDRARLEIELLARLHPDAVGTLADQSGKYADVLAEILDAASAWPGPPEPLGWPALAGALSRNRVVEREVDVARRGVWQTVLPRQQDSWDRIGIGRMRVAERPDGLLSYHVAVSDGIVYLHQPGMIRAIDLATGRAAWPLRSAPGGRAAPSYGAIYNWTGRSREAIPDRSARAGVPRYCVTVNRGRLFARMGAAWTGGGAEFVPRSDQRSRIIGIDLRTQKLLFDPILPAEIRWEFEAAPVAKGSFLFVSMRRRDAASAQVRVVCFAIETGRIVWERDIVRAEAFPGILYELTNSSLSLQDDTLYYNTNLGAIAALRAADGRVRWICRYRRSGLHDEDPDQRAPRLFRDLVPCLSYRGVVVAAAADCERIFALDAGFGHVVWATPAGIAADAVHLLGVGQGRLLASGDYLYWMDVWTGRLVDQFPAARSVTRGFAGPTPRGYGRGLLAGKSVYWPTHDYLYVFDQRSRRQLRQPIELATLGLTGGNLAMDGGVLLIASAGNLTALNEYGRPRSGVRPNEAGPR